MKEGLKMRVGGMVLGLLVCGLAGAADGDAKAMQELIAATKDLKVSNEAKALRALGEKCKYTILCAALDALLGHQKRPLIEVSEDRTLSTLSYQIDGEGSGYEWVFGKKFQGGPIASLTEKLEGARYIEEIDKSRIRRSDGAVLRDFGITLKPTMSAKKHTRLHSEIHVSVEQALKLLDEVERREDLTPQQQLNLTDLRFILEHPPRIS
jgi:hypothetical protein